jgi:CheY-like chemotaxis protein
MGAVLERTPGAEGLPPGGRAGLPRLRVLFVDDQQVCADSFAAVFRRQGHFPQVAYDGCGALAAALAFRPAVVFADLGLPDLSGHELARRLRRAPGLETVFLVALTGADGDEDRRMAFEAGFDAYLTKPVTFAEVQELLDQVAQETVSLSP